MYDEYIDDRELVDSVDQYLYFKRLKEENELFMNAAKEKIVKISERLQEKSMPIISERNGEQMVTIVAAETLVYDNDKFREAVGDKWGEYTVAKIDQKRIREAVLKGKLDAKIVAECTTIKKSNPYIKVVEHTGNDD